MTAGGDSSTTSASFLAHGQNPLPRPSPHRGSLLYRSSFLAPLSTLLCTTPTTTHLLCPLLRHITQPGPITHRPISSFQSFKRKWRQLTVYRKYSLRCQRSEKRLRCPKGMLHQNMEWTILFNISLSTSDIAGIVWGYSH